MHYPGADNAGLTALGISIRRVSGTGLSQGGWAKSIKTAAFSLVEVTFALGLLSVAVVPLFGLLPVGVNVFKEAVDTTVQSQIVAKLTNLAEQTDFANLNGVIAAKVTGPTDSTTPVYYYFDDQGTEITASSGNSGPKIYTAAVTYADETSIPCATEAASSKNMATLWVDIYNNKGVFTNGAPVDPRRKRFVIHIANFGRRI